MKNSLPSSVIQSLPVQVRLILARFTLYRRRHGSVLLPSLLTLTLMFLCGAVGYVTALQRHVQPDTPFVHLAATATPALGAARPAEPAPIEYDSFPNASDWGLLHAELSRVRVLFKRIADLSDFNGGEFDLDIEPLEPLSRSPGGPDPLAYPQSDLAGWALVKNQVNHMSSQAKLMLLLLENQSRDRSQTVSGRPVKDGAITSSFGPRKDPATGERQFHKGIDFAGTPDTRVVALADGVVAYSARNGGYGNLVELEHAEGYRSRYAHNSINLVSVGSYVRKGQAIALMGSTGKSTGTHVHVEIRKNGRALDPATYLR